MGVPGPNQDRRRKRYCGDGRRSRTGGIVCLHRARDNLAADLFAGRGGCAQGASQVGRERLGVVKNPTRSAWAAPVEIDSVSTTSKHRPEAVVCVSSSTWENRTKSISEQPL